MTGIKCFWLELTDNVSRALRRYVSIKDAACPRWGYHNADTPIEPCKGRFDAEGYLHTDAHDRDVPREDPRWPKQCACGYEFQPEDEWQVFTNTLYRRIDTGDLMRLRDAPPGAMWDAWWFGCKGADGMSLVVMTPGGEWMVDRRASNCTMPNDNVHKCWCRHGDPKTGIVTVDKNGVTCAAGGGSIMVGSYHGFLRNGFLVPA